MSGLTEDSWILISAYVFNLLRVVLIEVHENIALYRYVVRKGRNALLVS